MASSNFSPVSNINDSSPVPKELAAGPTDNTLEICPGPNSKMGSIGRPNQLSRLLQLITPSHISKDPGSPPNGGLGAWTQVLMSHLTNFNAFGYLLSFGIFQGYYTNTLGWDPSKVSWVGTTSLFLTYFVSVFSGRAMDAGYYHIILPCGLLLQLVGVFMTSLSTEYWQLLLAQGLCQGIGNGMLFVPAVGLVSTYFADTKRSVAVSLVACGGATGGMVFPAIAQSLLSRIGFAWTVRSMGFVMLFNSVLILMFSRTRLPPRKSGSLIDWRAFQEPAFVFFLVGVFVAFWGIFFAYYYIRPFGRDVLDVPPYKSFSILLILNGVGFPGRVVPALISDRYLGPVNTIIPLVFLCGVLLFCWISVTTLNGLYAWVAVYGFFGAGVQGLAIAAGASFAPDLDKVGGRLGLVFSSASFACLSGSPIGGRLIETHHGDYLNSQIFAGIVATCGSLLLLGARLSQTGRYLRQKK